MPEITRLNLFENKPAQVPLGMESQSELDPEFKTEGFWARRIPRRFKEKMVAGMMLGMTLLPMGVGAQSRKEGPKKETAISSSTERSLGAHWNMTAKTKDGKIYTNPLGIFPQIEYFSETKEQREMTFELPYEYSRFFDTAKPLNPEDHRKIADYIEQKVKEEFAENIHALVGSDDLYRAEHGEHALNQPKITDIRITGFASPEGPQRKGPDTMVSGAIDSENIDLAKRRAAVGLGLTEEALAKIGITREQLNETVRSVGAEELQLSPQEMTELTMLAANETGADPLEKIWHLTIKYNKGEIEDNNVKAKLDEILGSKRKVEVTIGYEDGKKDVYLFMIPWIIALPFLRRRRGEPEPVSPVKPEPVPPERLQLPGLIIPPKFKEVNLPDPDSSEYKEMEERASIDDLYVHFRNPETIRRGLDYQTMVDDVYNQYEFFKDDADREEFLAVKILQGWKDHDRAARKEAGVVDPDLDKGLDYENQDNQIRWAKMHAKALFKLVKQRKEFAAQGKNYGYIDLMTPEVVRLLKRRVGESSLGVRAEPEPAKDGPGPETSVEVPVRPETKTESPESRKEKFLKALQKKKDTFTAFWSMMMTRARKSIEEMDEALIEKYRSLREAWLAKREESLAAFDELSQEDQDKLAGIIRVQDVEAELQKEGVKPEQPPADVLGNMPIRPVEQTQPEQPAPQEQPVTTQQVETKRAEVVARQAAEANPEQKPPKGFMQKVKDAFARWRTSQSILGSDREQQAIQSQVEAQPEKRKSRAWSWLKERGKGAWNFGFWEFHQAEKFRSRTKEVAEDVKAYSTLIQGELNLNPEEAETEAWEIVKKLRDKGTDIYNAQEFANASKEITLRKAKENEAEIAFIVQNAKERLRERLGIGKGAFKEYKGEAGQTIFGAEDEKKFEAALKLELNRVRVRQSSQDMATFAKLMRQNLDDKWKWRYVWGGLEAAAGFLGVKYIVMKIEEAAAAELLAAEGGKAGAEAAQWVTTSMDQNVWNTMNEMAKNSPKHLNLNPAELKSLSHRVLDFNGMYESEWVNHVVEGLKSSRNLVQGFPIKIPPDVLSFLGY